MALLKIYYHIMAFFKKKFYKFIYGKKIKFGKNVTFRKGFSLMISKNGKVIIEDGCFFNNYCSINAMNEIYIGSNSIFGENVKIYDHNHVFKYFGKLVKNQGYKVDKINIGKNCWIGSNVCILKGAQIGDNSIIGANEVVKKYIAADNIYINGCCQEIIYEK